MMKRLLAAVAAITMVLAMAAPFADASDGEFVAPFDEPALCGSVVADLAISLAAYNSTIVTRACIRANGTNTFVYTDVATNTDLRCHVDLSNNRLRGIRERDEDKWFPYEVADFCIAAIVPSPTAVPTALPVVVPTGGGIPPGTPAAPQLAFTGASSSLLAYTGAGLIGLGAVALGSRRKFLQGDLE